MLVENVLDSWEFLQLEFEGVPLPFFGAIPQNLDQRLSLDCVLLEVRPELWAQLQNQRDELVTCHFLVLEPDLHPFFNPAAVAIAKFLAGLSASLEVGNILEIYFLELSFIQVFEHLFWESFSRYEVEGSRFFAKAVRDLVLLPLNVVVVKVNLSLLNSVSVHLVSFNFHFILILLLKWL